MRRTPMWSSQEGHGTPPSIEDYPFQGLDIETEPYVVDKYSFGGEPWFWLEAARTGAMVMRAFGPVDPVTIAAGNYKHKGRTPLGTSVADLARREIGMPTPHGDGWSQSSDSWRDGDTAGDLY